MASLPPFHIKVEVATGPWPGLVLSIESPQSNSTCEALSVEVAGFVARKKGANVPRPRALQFVVRETVLWETIIDVPRPDVIQSTSGPFEISSDDITCGFNASLPLFLSMHDGVIEAHIVHEIDEQGVELSHKFFTIIFESKARSKSTKAQCNVIFVNSIGRSGSSLLCKLLDSHPGCVAPKLMGQYGEVSVVGHYLRALAVLSSSGAVSELNKYDRSADFLSLPVGYLKTDPTDNASEQQFQQEVQVSTRELMISLLDNVFSSVAAWTKNAKPSATYFVEKSWNLTSANLAPCFLEKYKEIILIRDFRDFWRSQFLYHEKIGTPLPQAKAHAQGTYDKYVSLLRSCRDREARALLVRYEDLIARPRDEFIRILEYLELECQPTFLDKVEKISAGNDAHFQWISTAAKPEGLDDGVDGYLRSIPVSDFNYLRDLLEPLGYSL